MSKKELHRAEIVSLVSQKRMTQRVAAELLDIGERQVRRLQRAYEADGTSALASKKRGRRSNRRRADADLDAALSLVRERYADFGPTLACEKLLELHGVRLPVETLRWLM